MTCTRISARVQDQLHRPQIADDCVKTEAPNVLLVEDDAGLAAMLSESLAARGYRVYHASDAAEADAILTRVWPELVLVDLMLPDKNGLLLCSDVKARTGATVIVCSATKRKDDAVLALKLGADDFLAKPFSLDELEARMRRPLGHAASGMATHAATNGGVQRIGELVIDRTRCVVARGESNVQLTPTEYRLLCQLADRPSQVVSRRELVESVWGFYDRAVVRSLDVHMRRLRTKLSTGSARGPHVATRRGFGYQLLDF